MIVEKIFFQKGYLNIFVLEGNINFVFALKKNNKYLFKSIFLNSKKCEILHIPNLIWFGFKGMNTKNRLISLSSNKFDENEVLRKKINDINYNWNKK